MVTEVQTRDPGDRLGAECGEGGGLGDVCQVVKLSVYIPE